MITCSFCFVPEAEVLVMVSTPADAPLAAHICEACILDACEIIIQRAREVKSDSIEAIAALRTIHDLGKAGFTAPTSAPPDPNSTTQTKEERS